MGVNRRRPLPVAIRIVVSKVGVTSKRDELKPYIQFSENEFCQSNLAPCPWLALHGSSLCSLAEAGLGCFFLCAWATAHVREGDSNQKEAKTMARFRRCQEGTIGSRTLGTKFLKQCPSRFSKSGDQLNSHHCSLQNRRIRPLQPVVVGQFQCRVFAGAYRLSVITVV